MKIVLCASGPVSDFFAPTADYYIGVDRGALTLLSHHIVPDEIIGDFDSVTEEEFLMLTSKVSKIERVSSIKDETDTDLALEKAVLMQPEGIYVTCVTGGRLDHQEAVMRTVCRFQMRYKNIAIYIVNQHNTMRFLEAGTHILQKDDYQYISFFSIDEPIKAVTLTGVKYATNCVPMPRDCTLFTSNEIIADNASISISNGICLMIKSND